MPSLPLGPPGSPWLGDEVPAWPWEPDCGLFAPAGCDDAEASEGDWLPELWLLGD